MDLGLADLEPVCVIVPFTWFGILEGISELEVLDSVFSSGSLVDHNIPI